MRFLPALVLLIIASPGLLLAQEKSPASSLEFMPGVVFVKLFPGAPLDVAGWENVDDVAYAGTGLRFSVRCFTPAHPHFAITFGGGVTWYYDPNTYHIYAAPMEAGTGAQLWNGSFTVFPLSLGFQAVYPAREKDRVMFFAGAEGNLNLVDGMVAPGQQTRVGYTLLGGFVVKVLEFGVRYSGFSDVKNLGVHIGLRLQSFVL